MDLCNCMLRRQSQFEDEGAIFDADSLLVLRIPNPMLVFNGALGTVIQRLLLPQVS